MTRWSPDTCDCVVEYTDDGNFTATAVISKCSKHAATKSDAEHLTTVMAHNQKKNLVVTATLAHMASVNSPVAPENVHGAYDANDNLTLTGTGLNAGQIIALAAKVAAVAKGTVVTVAS